MKVAASLHDRVLAAAGAASEHLDAADATVAIILGSGLAGAADRLADARAVSYAALPCFPEPTVAGHPGRLLCGRWGHVKLLVFCGRVHLYEGYSAAEVAIPVRLAATLGVQTLIVTNVAGAIDPLYAVGEIVALADHINMTGACPLSGPNDERFGPRFIDMNETYSGALRELATAASVERFGAPPARGRLCRHGRPVLRNAGRGSHAPCVRRHAGRHVDGPRSHRGTPFRAVGAGTFDGCKSGRRLSERAAQARGRYRCCRSWGSAHGRIARSCRNASASPSI